jgi:hypothetical protein
MRLEPEQLVRLARLTDEWLDLSEVARAAWLAATLRHQPDLAPALLAMTAEAGPGKTAGNDPLSLPSMDGAAAADPSEHREGDLVGPYRLMSLLGIGGMGAVWLADQVDGRVQRKVAVKLLGPERAQAGWRLRFERERDILAAMEHPGIARLIDAGSASDGQPYLAMAYVKGQSIVSYAQQHKLDIAARVKLAIELLAIVQYAHASLVIHRDLKPGNILVDEDGRVALLDFGIAKLLASSDLTPASGDVTALAGNSLTLDYASPEQVSGRAMGVGTDIYSAGVVLYELLAGQRPYRLRRGTRAAMEEAILEQEVMPPSQRVDETYAKAMGLNPRKLSRQLHGDLDAILLKALARESALRYSTAEAFADDLRRWMDGRPVRAQGLSRWYVARRVLSRYRWPVAGAALVLASLSVGLGVALWQAGLAREEASAAKATESFLVDLFKANSVNQRDPVKAQQTTARELMLRAADQIPNALQGAPKARVRLLGLLSQLHGQLGMTDSAYTLKHQQVDQTLHMGGVTAVQLAQLKLELAMSGATTRPAGENRLLIEQAERLMDATGDRRSQLRGHLMLAKADYLATDPKASAAAASEAVSILRAYPPTSELIDAMYLLISGRCYSGEADDAMIRLADEAIQIAQQVRELGNLHQLYGVQALCLARLGRARESLDRASRALAASESSHSSEEISTGSDMSVVVTLTGLLQDFAKSDRALEVLSPRLDRVLAHPAYSDGYMAVRSQVERADIEMTLGHWHAARNDLDAAGARVKKIEGADDSLWSRLHDQQARWYLGAHDLSRAEQSLRESAQRHEASHHEGTVRNNVYLVQLVRLRLAQARFVEARAALKRFAAPSQTSREPTRVQLQVDLLRAEIERAAGNAEGARAAAQAVIKAATMMREPDQVGDLVEAAKAFDKPSGRS